eukprot:TRINITY_DN180_c0_g3_i2.p1 TRINITY_DN180_c0_g3~~TRINITY_DN180_c0_g3_i2.p1  ORF type:complete len:938 (-),score=374.84 TRINITY_DN180_c0_g3_i2:53-2866(-)
MSEISVSVSFKIGYRCDYGFRVAITGSPTELSSWKLFRPLNLEFGNTQWAITLSLPKTTFELEYKYLIIDDGGNAIRWEEGQNRKLNLCSFADSTIEIRDFWHGKKHGNDFVYSTAAFRDVIFRNVPDTNLQSFDLNISDDLKQIKFCIWQQQIDQNFDLFITGGTREIGNWDLTKSTKMRRFLSTDGKTIHWEGIIKIPIENIPFEYKYVAICSKTNKILWEDGGNRYFDIDRQPLAAARSLFIINDQGFINPVPWRGVGVAIPVFSLRSSDSVGSGEFPDIKKFVDWSLESGLHLIQILPVNDTRVHGSWWDSYPYSSLSVYALHPIYLGLFELHNQLKELGGIPKNLLEDIHFQQKNLEIEDGKFCPLKYEETLNFKIAITKKIWQFYQPKFENSSATAKIVLDYQKFCTDESEWLLPYSVFCALKEKFNTPYFDQWPKYNTITFKEVEELSGKESDIYSNFSFNCFIQFCLFEQLNDAANYAASKRVVLKGDLPIGVDPLSVDVWINPHLFRKQVSVGAPPDAFSDDGQNWGFPAYDWEAMQREDYHWWRERLRIMAKFFHAFRIDHILGFFRIWEISRSCVGGLIGRFNPSIPIWKHEIEDLGWWDINRLINPYIRLYHFQKEFPQNYQQIISLFFDEYEKFCFKFKDFCNTEIKLSEAIDNATVISNKDETKNKLIGFMRNVILIVDEEDLSNNKFYPRIKLFNTDSYHSLPDFLKKSLYDLYISYFYQRQDAEWRAKAMQKLPMMMTTTDMLVCGEDLGMIPDCVQGVLDELSLLGLRVQRMPKEETLLYDLPYTYSYLTVCTPSVHDTSTLRGWWEEDKTGTQTFYNSFLNRSGTAPTFCEADIVKQILQSHFDSQSMLTIICLQDFFALTSTLRLSNPNDERINIPAIRHHYWRYRMQLTIEELLENHGYLATDIKSMIVQSKRIANF